MLDASGCLDMHGALQSFKRSCSKQRSSELGAMPSRLTWSTCRCFCPANVSGWKDCFWPHSRMQVGHVSLTITQSGLVNISSRLPAEMRGLHLNVDWVRASHLPVLCPLGSGLSRHRQATIRGIPTKSTSVTNEQKQAGTDSVSAGTPMAVILVAVVRAALSAPKKVRIMSTKANVAWAMALTMAQSSQACWTLLDTVRVPLHVQASK